MPLEWRTTSLFDAVRIADLVARCDNADGCVESKAPRPIPPDALIAGSADRIAAAGWLDATTLGSGRLMLRGWIDPDSRRRGLGEALMARLLDAAAAREHTSLRIDRVLEPDKGAPPSGAVALYHAHGFRFNYVEDELRRSTAAPIPETPPLGGISIEPWSRQLDSQARDAYNDAFSTRQPFDPITEQEWDGRYYAEPDFRPRASFFAVANGALAGFIFSSGVAEGYIESVGVRPYWRGRGIADALLIRALEAYRTAGLGDAVLRVNTNNERARRVYDRLGFTHIRRHVSYVLQRLQKDRLK